MSKKSSRKLKQELEKKPNQNKHRGHKKKIESTSNVALCKDITVLSWNVWGKGQIEIAHKGSKSTALKGRKPTAYKGKKPIGCKGKYTPLTAARNQLVPEVVKDVNPDILLLQETKTQKIVDEISRINQRVYYKECKPLEDSRLKETRILYNSDKFEEQKCDTNLLQNAIQELKEEETQYEVKLREKEDGEPRRAGVGRVVIERTSWVCLKRKDTPNAKPIIFMSFHNYNNKDSNKGATVFCKAVAVMKRLTTFDVVAGGDFNCNIEKLPGMGVINIPGYAESERRKKRKGRGKAKIDFFVTEPKFRVKVNARDFTAPGDIARKLARKAGCTYTVEHYDNSVDHDPLICTLTISN